MAKHTRVVRNGDGVDVVKWGTMEKSLAWGAGIFGSLIVALLTAGVHRAFYISDKVDVFDTRITYNENETNALAKDATALKDALTDEHLKDQQDHQRFLTKDEFFMYMGPEIKRPTAHTRPLPSTLSSVRTDISR